MIPEVKIEDLVASTSLVSHESGALAWIDFATPLRPLIEELREKAIRAAEDVPFVAHHLGGKKVYGRELWDTEAARFITELLKRIVPRYTSLVDCHVVDRWANVMSDGDYSAPHAHYDSVVAAVLMLDTGLDGMQEFNGCFELVDPRIPFCCPKQPGHATRGIVPYVQPGLFYLINSIHSHWVHPLRTQSDRRRVTLAWNIQSGPQPADFDVDRLYDSDRDYFNVTTNLYS